MEPNRDCTSCDRRSTGPAYESASEGTETQLGLRKRSARGTDARRRDITYAGRSLHCEPMHQQALPSGRSRPPSQLPTGCRRRFPRSWSSPNTQGRHGSAMPLHAPEFRCGPPATCRCTTESEPAPCKGSDVVCGDHLSRNSRSVFLCPSNLIEWAETTPPTVMLKRSGRYEMVSSWTPFRIVLCRLSRDTRSTSRMAGLEYANDAGMGVGNVDVLACVDSATVGERGSGKSVEGPSRGDRSTADMSGTRRSTVHAVPSPRATIPPSPSKSN